MVKIPKLGMTPVTHLDSGFEYPGRDVLRVPAIPQDTANLPVTLDYALSIRKWPTYGNIKAGTCTLASLAHLIMAWTKRSRGRALRIRPKLVMDAYKTLTGYTPGQPDTDTGLDPLVAMDYFRTDGFGKHLIVGYGGSAVGTRGLDPLHLWYHDAWLMEDGKCGTIELFKDYIYRFGGIQLSLQLPVVTQTMLRDRAVWDIDVDYPEDGEADFWTPVPLTGNLEPNSWGGHCVAAVGYTPYKQLIIVSWGRLYFVSHRFLAAYMIYAYVPWCPQHWTYFDDGPPQFNEETMANMMNMCDAEPNGIEAFLKWERPA